MTVMQPEPNRRHSLGSSIMMIGLVLLAIAVVVWANLWKNDMRVSVVSVSGNLILTNEEILSLADIDENQRLFSVDLLAARNRVMQNAFIKSVSINREVPNTISISVKERVPIASIVADKIQFLDSDGVLLPPIHSENIFDLPVLTGSLPSDKLVPGKEISSPDMLEALAILSTAKKLGDDLYRRISEVHIEKGNDIILYTAEYGVPVIFGHGDIGMKLVRLDGFWKEIVYHRGAIDLAYIDLRFADQVVVRWNHDDAKMQATENQSVKFQNAKTS
jgi:cell division protein FtsQ